MGGPNGDHIVFRVDWAYETPEDRKMVEARDVRAIAVNPRYARTETDDAETTMPMMPQTRPESSILPALPNKPMIRWAKINLLGVGAFGEVSFHKKENKKRQAKPLCPTLK